MARVQPLQASMASGEISPLLLAQTTTERYSTGLAKCRNFIPLPQGPVVSRGGSIYVAEFADNSTEEDFRLFGLDIDQETSFVVAVGGENVQVFDKSGPVSGGSQGIERVNNGDFEAQLTGWTTDETSSGPQPRPTVEWEESLPAATLNTYLTGQFAAIGQAVSLPEAGEYTLTITTWSTVYIEDAIPRSATASFALDVGDFFRDDSIASFPLSAGDNQQYTFDVPTPGLVWLTFEANHTLDGASQWVLFSVSVKRNLPPTPVVFPSPWAGFARWRIQFEAHPTAAQIVFTHPNVAPHQLSVDASNVWSFGPITFVSQPPEWAGTNYPSAVTFAQGRMWMAGTPAQPTNVWGSVSDDFFNLTQTAGQDDSALEFVLAKRGQILWMAGVRKVVLGTVNAEWTDNPAGGVITPEDVDFREQSGYGSFAGQHVEVGDRVIYISGGERRVRVMSYDWREEAWLSIDLAWPSEHITKGRIQSVAYTKDPFAAVWMTTRDDHNVLACMYDREQRIVGWAKMEFAGDVQAIATTDNYGQEDIWALVTHNIDGQRRVYLELFDEKARETDCSIVKNRATASTTVTGLEHLEGLEVDVKVDGATHPRRVVEAGQIELQYPAFDVEVGRPYEAYFRTLPMEGGHQRGTAQGLLKRYFRVFLRLLESYPPLVNTQGTPDRSPETPMDTPEPPVTKDIDVRQLGWDRTAQVTYTRDKPVKVTVLGIFGELAHSGE